MTNSTRLSPCPVPRQPCPTLLLTTLPHPHVNPLLMKMRLLQRTHDDEIIFTNDIKDEHTIPPYAILSHTWGAKAERDEITVDDIVSKAGKTKELGYEKIRFCKTRIQQDNLQHFWIDTCCIDKSNKAEHRHAIQSMFRWYRKAARCYVFLSDVSYPLSDHLEREVGPPLWESTEKTVSSST